MPIPDPTEPVDPEPWSTSTRARNQAEMLFRIDERTNVLLAEIRAIKQTTITRAEFGPVKAIVYGMVALIMTTVLIAMVTLVLAK